LNKKADKKAHMPLVNALKKYADKNSVRFHMPGHKAREEQGFFKIFKENLYKWDVTELPDLDDLHQAKGVIKKAQQKLASLYGADQSYFLVNGTTSGVIAMMGAVLYPGDQVLVPRSCHKSILSGLILTGARPVYVMPEIDEELGVYTQVTPKIIARHIEQNPGIKAVLITNPVYQGFCPDIKGISKIIKDKDIVLLVDEAHGAHFRFSPLLPKGAEKYADAWVQSPHKTLSSFTQSAWLHIKGPKIDRNRLKDYISLVTSSSPSYILMASLDKARAQVELNGEKLVKRALKLACTARKYINKITAFYCVGSELCGHRGIYDVDLTRLMINVSRAGYTGYEVERILRYKFNIYAEYADLCNIYFLISFHNTKEDISRLIKALSNFKQRISIQKSCLYYVLDEIPKKALDPREAFNSKKEKVPLKASKGRICGGAIVPYPPGIPLVMPGEIIENDHIQILKEILKNKGYCQGITASGEIQVIK